jgi:hypothetical protein
MLIATNSQYHGQNSLQTLISGPSICNGGSFRGCDIGDRLCADASGYLDEPPRIRTLSTKSDSVDWHPTLSQNFGR